MQTLNENKVLKRTLIVEHSLLLKKRDNYMMEEVCIYNDQSPKENNNHYIAYTQKYFYSLEVKNMKQT